MAVFNPKNPYMRRKYLLSLFLFLSFAVITQAQKRELESNPYGRPDSEYDKLNLGLGIGFDYGGFGGNVTYYPQKNIGLFFGGGYAIAGFGYNAGLKYRFLSSNPRAQVTPFLMAMYGYNTAVHVTNASQLDKIFYGPTVGAGCDFGSHAKGRGAWSLAIFVPIRSSEPDDYMNHLKDDLGIEFKNKPWPIGLSVGYKFNLD